MKYKIVDLDIDDSLTGDTYADAIALVKQPAIEQEFMIFKKQKFETYDDYPQSARNNACRAIKWAEENGWGSCGTDVGKQRAHQLCNGENISEETIARMAAFERHRQNSKTPYGEGCGKLMWDAWGGSEGVEWAQRKLDQIRRSKEEMDIDTSNLPPYVSYATGETITKEIGMVKVRSGETEDEYISRCIPVIIGEGYLQDQAAAICYSDWRKRFEGCGCSDEVEMKAPCWDGYEQYGTKIVDGREVPNCIPIQQSTEQLDIFGYTTRFFHLCPGAMETFTHLMDMNPDEETIGMIRSAALQADRVFEIENEVLENGISTQKQLDEAIILVNDFKDLMREIDEELGMIHNVDYMDGHIELIGSYLRNSEDFSFIGYLDNTPYFECLDGNCDITHNKLHFSKDSEGHELFEAMDVLKNEDEKQFMEFFQILSKGRTETDIKRINHKDPTVYYKYKVKVFGKSDTRKECKDREDRYFRRAEIYALQNAALKYGHEKQPYSKWTWKFGPNCVHAWEKHTFLRRNSTNNGWAEGQAGTANAELALKGYWSEETKRKSELAYIISQQNMSKKVGFKSEKEKRMLYSPAMIPNLLIPRFDETTNEKYYVRFKPEVIEKIQQRFMIDQRLRATNYEHDDDQPFNDMVLVESWIVSGDKDKAYQLGFTKEQVPLGSWMVGYKILDSDEGDVIWNDYIKTGLVKGLSIQGDFLLKFSRRISDEYLLEEIINILNKIK